MGLAERFMKMLRREVERPRPVRLHDKIYDIIRCPVRGRPAAPPVNDRFRDPLLITIPQPAKMPVAYAW